MEPEVEREPVADCRILAPAKSRCTTEPVKARLVRRSSIALIYRGTPADDFAFGSLPPGVRTAGRGDALGFVARKIHRLEPVADPFEPKVLPMSPVSTVTYVTGIRVHQDGGE